MSAIIGFLNSAESIGDDVWDFYSEGSIYHGKQEMVHWNFWLCTCVTALNTTYPSATIVCEMKTLQNS